MRKVQKDRMAEKDQSHTMLVVMQQGATEAQIQKIIDRLTEDGFDVHRSTGVIHTVLGGVGGKDDFDIGRRRS